MPRQDLEYPKEPHSTINRYSQNGNYTLETIHSIINSTPFLHVSFNTPDSPFPAVIPMIGQMGSFERPSADLGDVLDLYIHGYAFPLPLFLPPSLPPVPPAMSPRRLTSGGRYISSRLISTTRTTSSPEGLPLTVAASTVDGLVLSLCPFTHSYNYRSAVLFGYATLVTDPAEKLYAMELITNAVAPRRWQDTRSPPTAGELASTSLLRVKITTGSAKIRTGPPNDDKADLENKEVTSKAWTGVVPVYTVMGEPRASAYNEVERPPKSLEDWRQDMNADGQDYAERAAVRGLKAVEKTKEDED
ncbi:hypothetical protein QBC35DRAFT_448987 [Podospora australis]|uniref:Flavin-nucleotide-binding protein n=1 Tax=Podospora australis TaxID=1536484 RepID=A0AAN6X3L5_9PEZI|nr:hypothetical protein QBC35DRAFT_448987 [Podospora australis]